ncbi:MAG: phosphoribosylformylglycinamidine synthase subunit PurL [Thermomicrobiales bacterium]
MSADAVWALEIVPNEQEVDPHARVLRHILTGLGVDAPQARHSALYLLQRSHSEAIERAVTALCLNPVLATARVAGADDADARWIIEVLPHPGVTDAEGDSLAGALHRAGFPGARARAGHRYVITQGLDAGIVAEAAGRLAHEVVEKVAWRRAGEAPPEGWWAGAFMPEAAPDPTVETVPLRGLDGDELVALSRKRLLSLPLADLEAVRDHFAELDRDPTDVELETIAQTWSEHCAHRTFKATITHQEPGAAPLEIRGLLKTYIASATAEVDRPWVLSAFKDNAGVIVFDDDYEISFKVETHNHPSAIEPFGGANTGVGGVVRDVLGVSAEPIANTDVLCFGPLDADPAILPAGTLTPDEVYAGVVAGIADYGNKMGIPTVNGATLFDAGYVANPLVFCGTVGLAPRGRRPTQPNVGDLVVVAGGRAGRDGIHGATFSSDVLGDVHAELGSVVQIGDPIVEKRLADALPVARDLGLYSAITDCGAGGLSSAIGEMAAELGADVELGKVPLKYDGLRPWEIWLSEAQERLVFAVPPEKWDALQQVFADEGVEATALGAFTGDGVLTVRYQGEVVAELAGAFLHDGMPLRTLESTWSPAADSDARATLPEDLDLTALLLAALAETNVASKEPIVRRYDHEVQGRTAGKPFVGPDDAGPADAAVLRPVVTSEKGVAVGCGINPWYGEIDPHAMALLVIDEALRNVVAVGADPDQVAILDNFCWGNPMLPDRLGGLVRASQGCHDGAVAYGVPFVSGKDSLYNEYKLADGESRAIPGTLLISAIGIVPDLGGTASMFLKEPGNALYLVGATGDDLGGSLAQRLTGGSGGAAPVVDLTQGPQTLRALHGAIRGGLVAAVHDLSEGGLAVALAEMALAGNLGAVIDVRSVPIRGNLPSDGALLFSETPSRFLVEVAPAQAAAFEAALAGTPIARIGAVTDGGLLTVTQGDAVLIEAPVEQLKATWQAPLADASAVEAVA